ncbi:MAG: hypothetical protein BWY95_00709 [Bacteroidetes bacterium ADurb.BinA104]|nr:MAG: hypothetical protein BWY95_00709 [Bacteroidetes bacterium ADurb.BinA104]
MCAVAVIQHIFYIYLGVIVDCLREQKQIFNKRLAGIIYSIGDICNHRHVIARCVIGRPCAFKHVVAVPAALYKITGTVKTRNVKFKHLNGGNASGIERCCRLDVEVNVRQDVVELKVHHVLCNPVRNLLCNHDINLIGGNVCNSEVVDAELAVCIVKAVVGNIVREYGIEVIYRSVVPVFFRCV